MHKQAALVFATFASALLSFNTFAQTLPSGWTPWYQEYSASEMNGFPKIEVDFNGDGQQDQARVLVLQNGQTLGLFVFLTASDGHTLSVKLEERSTKFGEYHLSPVSKGCYHLENGAQAMCLKYEGLAYTDLEYGDGAIHWFDRDQWRKTEYGRGIFKDLWR
ncbi:MAG TPA: hypothetical protein VJM53_06530 [Burkholderiales bacterium]|nr:hypothetical protein [Burkholderiales bacterium]